MSRFFLTRGVLALAVLAAAVCAVGITARGADAYSPFVHPGGPYAGVAGVPVSFAGSAQVGPITSAVWHFGDGTAATGLSVAKVFATPGIYSVTLAVTSISGQSFSDQTSATISGLVATPVVTAYGTRLIETHVSASAALPVVTVVGAATVGCGPTLLNGIYYNTCQTTSTLAQRVATFNPACYQLWLQTGVVPACALAYR